jgi:hypothetical protein
MDFLKIFESYGFPSLIIGTLFLIVWRLLIWVMKWVEKREDAYSKERDAWLCRLEKQNDNMNKIVESIDRHDDKAEERGRYVREEHKQMIEVLARINGYKKE